MKLNGKNAQKEHLDQDGKKSLENESDRKYEEDGKREMWRRKRKSRNLGQTKRDGEAGSQNNS
jgi:hypothetical protein